MDATDIDRILRQTLADRRLSRGEKRVMRDLLAEEDATTNDLALWRSRAFVIAGEELKGRDQQALLDWLEDVVKALRPAEPAGAPTTAEVHFSPGDNCLNRLRGLLATARWSADICVFTITDDRISRAIIEAHKRGVNVRVISDDMKSEDLGSDIHRFEGAGIDVRVDRSRHHMHHKFALFDRRLLVTGSYNWTRSAASSNEENLIVSDDPRLAKPFADEFERLWKEFG